jgi:hypothetical protein
MGTASARAKMIASSYNEREYIMRLKRFSITGFRSYQTSQVRDIDSAITTLPEVMMSERAPFCARCAYLSKQYQAYSMDFGQNMCGPQAEKSGVRYLKLFMPSCMHQAFLSISDN